jgi:hypothetical protein
MVVGIMWVVIVATLRSAGKERVVLGQEAVAAPMRVIVAVLVVVVVVVSMIVIMIVAVIMIVLVHAMRMSG